MPLILKWAGISGPITLIIHRTNWKLGNLNINILCIIVLGDEFCVPLICKLLPKRSNTLQAERMDPIGKRLDIPNLPRIKTIIGDRDFIGLTWFKYMKNNSIDIIIRLKDNQYAKRNDKRFKVSNIIIGNTIKGSKSNGKQNWINNIQVYIHGFKYRNTKGKI